MYFATQHAMRDKKTETSVVDTRFYLIYNLKKIWS